MEGENIYTINGNINFKTKSKYILKNSRNFIQSKNVKDTIPYSLANGHGELGAEHGGQCVCWGEDEEGSIYYMI